MSSVSSMSPALRRALRRPVVAGALLLLVYAGLSLAMDPHGFLGTDTGTKVATLEVMDRGGTSDPDIGYWAQAEDPTGALHPLYQTTKLVDGRWVAVTTLPLLEAARPLYAVGGYRLTLLLPMLGAVGTAFAARGVAKRVTVTDGWDVFWLVGLGSPIAIYALDLWEHSIGVACIVAAVVLLVDVAAGRGVGRAVLAGALLGGAASMRTEAFVYALVAVVVTCLLLWRRSGTPLRAVPAGVGALAGFATMWVGNVALEDWVGGLSRSNRAGGAATSGGSDLADRLREAMQTLTGANSSGYETSVFIGAALVGLVLLAIRAERRGDRRLATVCLGLGGFVYLAGALGGLGFVPGLMVAFPMAIAGVLVERRGASGMVLAISVGALPLVYAFQYVGGGAPQWGGRYTLASSILLGTLGVTALRGRFPAVLRGLVALSVGVTVLGVLWLGQRSRGVDEFFDDLVDTSEPVVIARQAFLLREGGAEIVGRRWLSVKDEETFTAAVDVARSVGEPRFTVLEWGGDAPPPEALPDDVVEVERRMLRFVDVPVGAVTYEFTG